MTGILRLSICLSACILLAGCGRADKEQRRLGEEMELKLPKDLEGTVTDDHDNFHGDGLTAAKWELSEEEYEEILEQVRTGPHWNGLPLPRELEILLYGGTLHNTEYAYNLAEQADIPRVEQGYYLFVDNFDYDDRRSGEAGYGELLDRMAFNFVYGVLDTEEKILYFMKFDS